MHETQVRINRSIYLFIIKEIECILRLTDRISLTQIRRIFTSLLRCIMNLLLLSVTNAQFLRLCKPLLYTFSISNGLLTSFKSLTSKRIKGGNEAKSTLVSSHGKSISKLAIESTMFYFLLSYILSSQFSSRSSYL